MANKTEYLADLAGKSFIQEIGTPELQTIKVNEQQVSPFLELELNVYIVQLLEKTPDNSMAQPVKHKFSVYKEGEAQETAFASGQPYKPFFNKNNNTYQAIVSYIMTIPNVRAYWVKEWDKETNYAKVRAFIEETDHIEEKWFLIWNDNGLTHSEITVLTN